MRGRAAGSRHPATPDASRWRAAHGHPLAGASVVFAERSSAWAVADLGERAGATSTAGPPAV